jgi:uridine kinase
MWPKVRLGEKTRIFPFQKEADVAFNTALDYEHAVRARTRNPSWRKSRRPCRNLAEAVRIQQYQANFLVIPTVAIPRPA